MEPIRILCIFNNLYTNPRINVVVGFFRWAYSTVSVDYEGLFKRTFLICLVVKLLIILMDCLKWIV